MSSLENVHAGQTLPGMTRVCDNVQSFFYNAALWNAHRIHYDLPYATDAEGYPGLVVPGPLLGDWMSQVVDHWIDGTGAVFEKFEYSNRLAVYVGDEVQAGGTVTEVADGCATIELFVRNANGDVVAPGKARVRLA